MSSPLTQAPPDPDALLSGGGGRAGRTVTFKNLHEWKTMLVKGKETVQARDDDGKLETWDDGNPKWVVVVTVQIDQRDPVIEDDDGIRYLWLKGSKDPSKKTLMSSTITAYETAGCKSLEIGGELSMAWVGEGVKSSPTRNPPKFYEAKFVPAADVAMRSGNSNGHTTAPTPAPAASALVASVPTPAPAAPVAQNGGGASGLDWSQLGHLPADVRIQLASIPGLTTEAVLAMHPAPVVASTSDVGVLAVVHRADFPGVDERQWTAIQEAVAKGADPAALKVAFGGLG